MNNGKNAYDRHDTRRTGGGATRKADQRQVPVDNVVQEALEWYLRMNTELLDELAAWQEVRDEAVEIVEGTPS